MRFLLSIKYACSGLKHSFLHEKNFRIQFACAIIIIATGFVCRLDPVKWCIILLCIGMVLCLEMVNTIAERICNLVQPEFHAGVKIIKDTAAAAVLFFCIVTIVCACILFYPFISSLIKN